MKRVIFSCAVLLTLMCFLSGCGHTHNWSEANCTTPKTCKECGQTEGEALGHSWSDATCTTAKTCSRCGMTDGEPLGHEWNDATCTEAKICSRCGASDGEPLGHTWGEATCTEPKTCSRCGATEGEALGHDTPDLSCTDAAICTRCGIEIPALGHDWVEATCTEPKTCSRCGATEGDSLGHTSAEPVKENITAATCTDDGQYDEVVYCSLCHEELSRETITEPALGHTTTSGVCSRCGAEMYEPITGRGDDVISNVVTGDGLYKIHITNSGRSNFAVWVYDKDDDRDLAVNEIGNYDGYYFLEGAAPYSFEIESKGSWSLTVEKMGKTDTTSFKGKGDYVTDLFSASSGSWHIKHNGAHNFAVWLYTTDGRDLIVNEIGKYDGKRRLSIPSGSYAFLAIEADGSWSIEPAE